MMVAQDVDVPSRGAVLSIGPSVMVSSGSVPVQNLSPAGLSKAGPPFLPGMMSSGVAIYNL